MDNLHRIQSIIDENKEKMPDGVYLELCNAGAGAGAGARTRTRARVDRRQGHAHEQAGAGAGARSNRTSRSIIPFLLASSYA